MLALMIWTFLGLTSLVVATPVSLSKRSPEPFSLFTKNPVYLPLEQAPLWRTAYARAIQLADSSLLGTWEDYPYGENATNLDTFKIIRSVDGGATWYNISQVHDTQNGWGMRFQPSFHITTQPFGKYPPGTLLIGGVSCPLSLVGGVYIDVYASMDCGQSWEFTGHVAYGAGPETVTTGNAAIWEPFFLEYEGKMYVYFSDQRDPAHSQKLSVSSSDDLQSWSTSIDVVTHSNPDARPGMAVISYIIPTGQYFLTYEYCNSGAPGCPATYRFSSNPTTFVDATDHNVSLSNGYQPGGSPYTVYYHPPGTDAGSIVLSTNSDTDVFVSKDYGRTWSEVNLNQYTGQSRHLLLFNDNGIERLHLITGGFYGCSGSCYNFVANGVSPLDAFEPTSD